MDWKLRRGQIKHLLYEHCLNGRIDAQLLKEQFNDLNNVEPTKRGEWWLQKIPFKGGHGQTATKYKCSNCNGYSHKKSPFCPNCGAHMMDEVEEDDGKTN